MTRPHIRPLRVLLVEDNEADARLILEGLKETKARVILSVVADGESAMEFLRKQGDYGEVATPDLVVLDLNLPGMDGREVLTEITSDEKLRRTPLIVLTTSGAEEDISKCYDLGANCYITKPLDLDQFIDVVRSIERFWFEVVTLPEK